MRVELKVVIEVNPVEVEEPIDRHKYLRFGADLVRALIYQAEEHNLNELKGLRVEVVDVSAIDA